MPSIDVLSASVSSFSRGPVAPTNSIKTDLLAVTSAAGIIFDITRVFASHLDALLELLDPAEAVVKSLNITAGSGLGGAAGIRITPAATSAEVANTATLLQYDVGSDVFTVGSKMRMTFSGNIDNADVSVFDTGPAVFGYKDLLDGAGRIIYECAFEAKA